MYTTCLYFFVQLVHCHLKPLHLMLSRLPAAPSCTNNCNGMCNLGAANSCNWDGSCLQCLQMPSQAFSPINGTCKPVRAGPGHTCTSCCWSDACMSHWDSANTGSVVLTGGAYPLLTTLLIVRNMHPPPCSAPLTACHAPPRAKPAPRALRGGSYATAHAPPVRQATACSSASASPVPPDAPRASMPPAAARAARRASPVSP